jgi:nucleoid-associated protein YgaU
MPRDAKLGFVVGVALVIVIAAVFYQGNGRAGAPGNLRTAGPTDDSRVEQPERKTARLWTTPVPGLPPGPAAGSKGRTHTVQEGETLSSLAVRYYGDASQSSFLFRANRSQLLGPDRLPVGTVLLIPELPPRSSTQGAER